MAASPISPASASSFYSLYHPAPALPPNTHICTRVHAYIHAHKRLHSPSRLQPNPVTCGSQKCHAVLPFLLPRAPFSSTFTSSFPWLAPSGFRRNLLWKPSLSPRVLARCPPPPSLGSLPFSWQDTGCTAPQCQSEHLSPLHPKCWEGLETMCQHLLNVC